MKAISAKAASDLAAERDQHQRAVLVLQQEFVTAETRWNAKEVAYESQMDRQLSLLRIWREIISDLRLRLKFLQMWIWGFRRWHYNVQELQLEALHAHQQALDELDVRPKLDDFNVDAWDIHAIAAGEFGMADLDGDGILDDHTLKSKPMSELDQQLLNGDHKDYAALFK